MGRFDIYKPNGNFPQRRGAAFQFEIGTKKGGEGKVPTPCIFVTAAPQTKHKPAKGAKGSAFVWMEKDGTPHPESIRICLDLVDLSQMLVMLEGYHKDANGNLISSVQLVHQYQPQGSDVKLTKDLTLDHVNKEKDTILSMSQSAGKGHNKVMTYLKPHEKIALREIVRIAISKYYATPTFIRKDS
jgi:hypothetical protein